MTNLEWPKHCGIEFKRDSEAPKLLCDDAGSNAQQFVVRGRVTDEQGNGLPGVTVAANCGAGTLKRTGEAQTDDNGSYVLRFGPGMHFKDETTGKWGVGVQAATIHPTKRGYFDQGFGMKEDVEILPDGGGLGDVDLGEAFSNFFKPHTIRS